MDETLGALLQRDALPQSGVEVAFDAPTKEWAAGRSGPTAAVFLYDIREDPSRRRQGEIEVRDESGRITGRAKPPRYFVLSYLVSAWTQHPQDEHRLLSAILQCLLRNDCLPEDLLPAELRRHGPIALTVAQPPPQDRSFADVWSALGGQLRPALDVTVTLPISPSDPADVAPLVSEPLAATLHRLDAQ